MGYSARYHTASLAAVFLALGVGILIGAEFGDDVISGTAEGLEQSLSEDLDEANATIEDLERERARQERFADAVYPALVGDALIERDIAVVAFSSRPDDLRDTVLEALEPTGAEITQVAVFREPPDFDALAELGRSVNVQRGRREREELAAQRAGQALVTGGEFYQQAQETLLSAFSGEVTPVDGVIVVRPAPPQPADEEGDARREAVAIEEFETNVLGGLTSAGVPVIGVERTDADPSSIEFFASAGLTTVDDVELVAGWVALVYALRGAQGSFGIGEDADELLPPLLGRQGAPGVG
jgi:phosphoglycolate phosphatase-like HAD superfamily hydrolase